jgi:small subunit ribosomal protein S6
LPCEGVSVLYPYEILIIFDPRPSDEDITTILNRLQETLKSLGAQVGKVESWGKRRLTFEIRKQREGTYAVIEASVEPAAIREFERQLKLNEQVLRFVSTRVPVRKRARGAAKQEAPVAAPAEEGV